MASKIISIIIIFLAINLGLHFRLIVMLGRKWQDVKKNFLISNACGIIFSILYLTGVIPW